MERGPGGKKDTGYLYKGPPRQVRQTWLERHLEGGNQTFAPVKLLVGLRPFWHALFQAGSSAYLFRRAVAVACAPPEQEGREAEQRAQVQDDHRHGILEGVYADRVGIGVGRAQDDKDHTGKNAKGRNDIDPN